jgi:hypothetical protein
MQSNTFAVNLEQIKQAAQRIKVSIAASLINGFIFFSQKQKQKQSKQNLTMLKLDFLIFEKAICKPNTHFDMFDT